MLPVGEPSWSVQRGHLVSEGSFQEDSHDGGAVLGNLARHVARR